MSNQSSQEAIEKRVGRILRTDPVISAIATAAMVLFALIILAVVWAAASGGVTL